jgi:response regulator RpfG family c-di-GMP phosphodiesterase
LNITQPIHIYLADDDDDDRTIFSDTLKETSLSARLIPFEDGENLIRSLEVEESKPHIIFLDLKMPGKNGKECLREIRNNPQLNDIPVVIFTCTSYIDDIKETYEFGANLYVPKNVFIKNNKEALSMILDTTLNKSHLSPSKEKFVLGGDTSFIWT